MTLPLGELAALSAAALWAVTSLFFTAAGQSATPVAANTFKVVAATLMFGLTSLARGQGLLPIDMGWLDFAMLALSGVVGLSLGDSFLFKSFLTIGTRRAMLLMAMSPVAGALGGVLLLGESMSPRQILGMAIALGGVGWVLAERGRGETGSSSATRRRVGVLYGIGAAIGQAAGAVLAKSALERVPTLDATFVRVASAALVLVLTAALAGRLRRWLRLIRSRPVLWRLILGSIGGPYAGIWLMIFALGRVPTGVVLTLVSTTPIWLLLLGAASHRDRPGLREAVGASLAVVGVAVLLLHGAQ